jgi:hypothetical protein
MLYYQHYQQAYPPRSPNSLAQSSYSFNPDLLTLGLIVLRLVMKSATSMGRISSIVMCRSASPRDRNGPMAASFAKAVMSDPENPGLTSINGCNLALHQRGKGVDTYRPLARQAA